MPYQLALDGVRGVAVLLVVLFHANAPVASGGYVGVDVFFVLSGYLITAILLGELGARGRIDLLAFYSRRFMRLTPPLLLMLAAYLLASPILWPDKSGHALDALLAATYLADYARAFWSVPVIVGHTWSLAVEEHFYLLWPPILVLAWRRWDRMSLVWVFASAYLIVTLWRWTCVVVDPDWAHTYFRFDTRCSGLLLGAWLAALRQCPESFDRLERALPVLMWAGLLFVVMCLQSKWGDPWMAVWGMTSAEWFAVALIVAAKTPGGQIAAMLSVDPLAWLGRMSYGIYLWHFPIFGWLLADYRWEVVLLVGLPLSVVLAAASYYTVEAWARQLRSTAPPLTSSSSC